MHKRAPGAARREGLSRNRIIEASIGLLDASGAGGLTFRALSDRLATGPGAIYWHVASKGELLTAACDAIVARTVAPPPAGATPAAAIRALAVGMFDAIDAHPWVGSALTLAPGQMPMVRILEGIGRQVRTLGLSSDAEWAAVSALLNYILGVGGQHAANKQLARTRGLDRSGFLQTVSALWSELDPHEYPFTRTAAGRLPAHDDRLDFLAGIDLILRGLASPRRRSRPGRHGGRTRA